MAFAPHTVAGTPMEPYLESLTSMPGSVWQLAADASLKQLHPTATSQLMRPSALLVTSWLRPSPTPLEADIATLEATHLASAPELSKMATSAMGTTRTTPASTVTATTLLPETWGTLSKPTGIWSPKLAPCLKKRTVLKLFDCNQMRINFCAANETIYNSKSGRGPVLGLSPVSTRLPHLRLPHSRHKPTLT